MFRAKKCLLFLLKWTITLVAVGNLIFLFVFDYKLPIKSETISADLLETDVSERQTRESASPESETFQSTETETESPPSETTTEPSLEFQITEKTLTYDGSSELNLLDGVSLVDTAGNTHTDVEIFSSIKPGTNSKEKIIEYSASNFNGTRITAKRTLQLGYDYPGPMIELHGEIAAIPAEELSSILQILHGSQLITANDGFGKDISTSITASAPSFPDDSNVAIVTLSVTNLVNDSCAVDVIVPLLADGPTIQLTTSQVYLKIGESFSFYDYIASAVDANGNDLHRNIILDGSVNTSTAGTYVLKFSCFDSSGELSPIKTLTVIVE